MLDLWKREPARCAAILMSMVALAVAFGWRLTDAQQNAIKDTLTLVLALLGSAEVTRAQVSPVAKGDQ